MERLKNFINGEYQNPVGGRFAPNLNPATGEVYCEVADSSSEDVHLAIQAAHKAFGPWAQMPVSERAQILLRLAHLIEQQNEDLAQKESIDSGKCLETARKLEIPRSRANFEFFAHAITQFHGESFQTDRRALNQTHYSPLGVVAAISPWNLPLYLLTWKIAPALAAGNTVVAKPSEVTPASATALGALARQAGLPPGVLNIVHGTGDKVGAPLVEDPRIKAITFTGSTATGRRIAQVAGPQFKKMALEMGGKNPSIVFADCDFAKALDGVVRAGFSNQGQICLCGSRILVERSIYEKFRNALVERVSALRIGDPFDPQTQQGALVSSAHLQKIDQAVQTARSEGGRILCGGKRPKLSAPFDKGYFYEPTLIEGLPPSCRTNQEEIFGPVATLTPFDSEEEALQLANGTQYGLAANLWTQDIQRAHRVALALEMGIVWINSWMLRDLRTPFGGVKQSGYGREGGNEALRFFSEIKNICIGLEGV